MALYEKGSPCDVRSVSRQVWVSANIVEVRPCGSLVVQYHDGAHKVVPQDEVSLMVRPVLFPDRGHECEVWSQSRQKWMKGTISGIYQGKETTYFDLWGNFKSNSAESDQYAQSEKSDPHPIGSVKVDFQVAGGQASKVVAPENFRKLLQNIHKPSAMPWVPDDNVHKVAGVVGAAAKVVDPTNSACTMFVANRGKDIVAGAVSILVAQVPVVGSVLGPTVGNHAGEAHVKFVESMAEVEKCSVPKCDNLFKSITGGKVCPTCQLKGLDERMITQVTLAVKKWVG